MKTFPREQFEEMALRMVKNFTDEFELTDGQFDLVVKVVADTMTQSLLAQGFELPWVKRRRN
jgi:hypothetical protein